MASLPFSRIHNEQMTKAIQAMLKRQQQEADEKLTRIEGHSLVPQFPNTTPPGPPMPDY